MKTIILIFAFCASLLAQNIHEVQPGTEGNQIALSIENISSELSSESLWIRETADSPNIFFSENSKMIDKLDQNSTKSVLFEFDVDKKAPANALDTIKFKISDLNDNVWSKEIVLKYLAPTEFTLEQNYPNPFNPSTVISYQLSANSKVELKVFDLLGREAATLVNDNLEAGYHETKWNASGFASGMYIYQMIAKGSDGDEKIFRKKMILLK